MRILFSFFLLGLAVSCKDTTSEKWNPPIPGPGTSSFLHNYIVCYADGDMELADYYPFINVELNNKVFYASPDCYAEDENTAEFLRLAELNGDTAYDTEEPMEGYTGRVAFADNFKELHVICTNRDVDDAHPSGALLDDVVHLMAFSYADFIRSGYVGKIDAVKKIYKLVSELTADDLAMLAVSDFSLVFPDNWLTPELAYDLQVTFVTTGGEKKIGLCRVNAK